MLGFKRFDTAAVTITGIELAEKIKKHQFETGKLSEGTGNNSGDLGSCFRCVTASRFFARHRLLSGPCRKGC
jgi:hypothetical protein